MLVVGVCFAVGILVAGYAPINWWSWAVAITITCGIAAYLTRGKAIATPFVLVAVIAAGAFAYFAESHTNASPTRIRNIYDSGRIASHTDITFTGTVVSNESTPDASVLTIASQTIDELTATGNVRVFVPNDRADASQIKYGDAVRVGCALKREDEFLTPGVMPTREMLNRMGIDATCSLSRGSTLALLSEGSRYSPLALIQNSRNRLIASLNANLGPSAAGVMNASLLGNRYYLDKQTADTFREGGTFHILVISGMHITIVGALLMFVMRRATKRRWVQFGVTVGFVWAYTLAVGADVPVTRAAVMFTAYALAAAVYRKADLLNLFGATCVLLLVWRPSDLFGPSFQLTIVSVFAIIAIAVPLLDRLRSIGEWTPTTDQPFPSKVSLLTRSLCETLYWNPAKWQIDAKRNIWSAGVRKRPFFGGKLGGFPQRVVRFVFEVTTVSLIVQTAMIPLSAYYFHRIAFSSIINNLWVGPLLALETCLVIIGAVLGSVADILGRPFFLAADTTNYIMLALPSFTAYLSPTTRIPDMPYGKFLYVAFSICIVVLAFAALRWNPFLRLGQVNTRLDRVVLPSVFAIALITVLILLHPFSVRSHDGRMHVNFLDVGQGDSIFVVFPNGKTMLIDGGGRFNYRENDNFHRDTRSIGEGVVSEFLWSQGRSHIDHIVATHADADHVQGLEDVVRNFDVGSAIFGRASPSDTELDALFSVLEHRKVPVERLSRGIAFNVGDVRVEVLSPVGSEVTGRASDNDQSLVMRLVYGSHTFLLTGDIESAAERQMLASGGTISSTVVKVPHHGSRTSSTAEFVASTNAQYAVVSAGHRSQFGHPHREVVERWKAAGVTVMTTPELGTITFTTDGNSLKIDTFRNDR